MRHLFLLFSSTALVYFMIGFFYANLNIDIFDKSRIIQPHPDFYDYRGVTHVVTSHSKGSLRPPEILLEAGEADLDFLFFTDLNLMERPYSIQGYQQKVFTFSNQKISYLDSHILIYTDNLDFYFDSLSASTAQLHEHFASPPDNDKKFLAVLAHPFKIHHQWSGDYPVGLDGIEVFNMRQQWQSAWFDDRLSFIWSIFIYPFNPDLALLRLIHSPDRELNLWDTLNTDSKVIGLLGNQTTAKVFNFLGQSFTFPSYEKSFRFASNHILLESELTGYTESDRRKIFQAIQQGQFYFSIDSLADPTGFAAYLEYKGNKSLMGQSVRYTDGLRLKVDLPTGISRPHRIEVYRNGDLYFHSDKSTNESIEIKESGVYRVLVKVQLNLPVPDTETWINWIYTNPFYVDAT